MVNKFFSGSSFIHDLYLLRKSFILLFLTIGSSLFAQGVLTIQETFINNKETGSWSGVNIPRSEPTSFTYINNSITSVNSNGYMLQAGDESENPQNNNLNGMLITGNKFTWNGTDLSSITHGVFTGYNINSVVKYNFLDKTPHGILFKSGTDNGLNMTYSSGGASYNILKNARVSLRIKGMNGIHVTNNTFYNDEDSEWALSIIEIDANNDRLVSSPSLGARIYNNVFYTRKQIPNIKIESGCLSDFESDYNVFYCETGTPLFDIDGSTRTFAEWQALGYDTHSVVVNPDFVNSTTLVPASRLDYGTDLGTEWQTGLSTGATWGSSSVGTTVQNGIWQAGARVYAAGHGDQVVKIYPNPASDHVSISINEPTSIDYIRIITISNVVIFQDRVDPNLKEYMIPLKLIPGLYFLQLGLNNKPQFTEKLVIAR